MKIKKREITIGLVVIAVFIIIIGGSQIYNRLKNRDDLAGRIHALSSSGPPETVEGLKTAIAAYEQQIEAHVRDAAQTGVYYKILAIRLQDNRLHNEALEALERALDYNPVDATLHYLAGLSLANKAKSSTGFTRREGEERERLYAQAEESYLKAIELDDRYLRPRYGLGVLYVFELDRPEDAVPHLERYLEISRNDEDTIFVLARAYYMTGAFEKALEHYDRLISLVKDQQRKSEARVNRQIVLEQMNE